MSSVTVNDIPGLFYALKLDYRTICTMVFLDYTWLKTFHWCLERQYKSCVAAQGNILPSIPVAYSTTLKNYESLSKIMSRHSVCVSSSVQILKWLHFLLVFRQDISNTVAFLCLWDLRATARYYVRKKWPHREAMEPGQHNVQNRPLVPKRKFSYHLFI